MQSTIPAAQQANLRVTGLRVDPSKTQPRVEVDRDWVDFLTHQLKEDPEHDHEPVSVFEDTDGTLWLGDGHHRYNAYEQARREFIPAEVYQGDADAAYLHSVEKNGLASQKPLTMADRKAIARRQLTHPEWKNRSLRAIARTAGISHEWVRQIKKEIEGGDNVVPFERGGGELEQHNRNKDGIPKQHTSSTAGDPGGGALPLPNTDARTSDSPESDAESAPRMAHDYYPTPEPITRVALATCWKRETPETVGTIVECCAGSGEIARVLQGWGSDVITNEPYFDQVPDFNPATGFIPDWSENAGERIFWEMLRDSLAAEGKQIDSVVTNPPYEGELMLNIFKLAWEFCERGVLLHIRLGYLEPCENRAEFLQSLEDHIRCNVPVSPRPNYRRDRDGPDNVTSDWLWVDKKWSWSGLGVNPPPFKFAPNWKDPPAYQPRKPYSKLVEGDRIYLHVENVLRECKISHVKCEGDRCDVFFYPQSGYRDIKGVLHRVTALAGALPDYEPPQPAKRYLPHLVPSQN
ncbi:MAG: hypothetical protein AAFY26_18720 [Cyanobacteria bacterium J06638_22]